MSGKEKPREGAALKYADIIDLPHHVSDRHPQMPRIDRAAQFAPFAALTGLEEAMDGTAKRVTDDYLRDNYDEIDDI